MFLARTPSELEDDRKYLAGHIGIIAVFFFGPVKAREMLLSEE